MRPLLPTLGLMLCLLHAATTSASVPAFVPTDPNYVVLKLGSGSSSLSNAQLQQLRAASVAAPSDAAALAAYVDALIATGRSSGVERYFGYAEAALTASPLQSIQLSLLKAQLLQYRHDFSAAQRVLDQVLAQAPMEVNARLMRAQIRVQLAQAEAARQDCLALTRLTDLLTSSTCLAQARALQGDPSRAYAILTVMLKTQSGSATTRSWSAGIAAELAARLDNKAAAEDWYVQAIQLDAQAHYPRIAYADWLLQEGRYDDALKVAAQGNTPADVLRVVLAQRNAHSAAANQLQLAWDEAHLRAERGQLRDQARFEWWVLKDARRAHRTALDNFSDRRDPEDALLLAMTASATHDRAALQQVQQWLAQRGYYDVRLQRYLKQQS